MPQRIRTLVGLDQFRN